MRRIITFLLLGTVLSAAFAQKNNPAEMGLERVARLFTEVYQSPKTTTNNETLWIQIDLGESKKIDAVKLYPRVNIYNVVASEGFPEMFSIEASDDPDFKTTIMISDKLRGFPDPYDKVCTFEVEKANGVLKKRYIRITAIKLRQQHLAFTKIDVLSDGKNIAEGCRVSDSKNGDLGKHVVTRGVRPNGEGVVTNNPQNIIPEKQWKPVAFKAGEPVAGSVCLKDGIFKTTLDNNIDYLMSTLTLNEMTRNFRVRAGKEVEPFNDALSRQWVYNLPGSEAGRFLMGAGNTLKWHENCALRERMDKIVDVIDDCKETDGYIMAYKKEDIFTAEHGAYVRSWVTNGLLDAGYGGNKKAFGLVRGYYDWFNNSPYLPELLRRSGQGPQGAIANTRTYLSPVGKSSDIYTVQQYFQENYFLDGLANRDKSIIWRYPYDRPHNYLLTAIEPYFDLYRATGHEKYYEAVKGGWDLYKENWLHVGGSIAICEGTFLYPPQSYYLTRQTGELCGSVFWIKLNQRFHYLNPDEEKYVNEIEKCIYNVGIANQKGVNGIRYFNRLVDQKDQEHGAYVQKMNSCCEGQGTRLYGSLPEFIYSRTDDGVYINLFAASTLNHTTQSGELQLSMETQFPYDNKVNITLTSKKSMKSTIRVRVPSWVARSMIVKVNGKKSGSGEPGSYVTLSKIWNSGDEISFELPMAFKTTVYKGLEEGYNDGSHYIVEYGPIVMAAVNQKNPQSKIELELKDKQLEKNLSPVPGKPLFFSIHGKDDVVFRPYFELQDELFTCYPSITFL
jgi:uncharacterized protein